MLFEYVLKEWKGGGGCHQRRKVTVLNLKSNLVISNWWWCGRQIQDIQGLKNYRYKENDSWDFIAISICIYIILDINAKDSYNSVRILLTLSKVNWTLSDNTVNVKQLKFICINAFTEVTWDSIVVILNVSKSTHVLLLVMDIKGVVDLNWSYWTTFGTRYAKN